MFSQLSKLVSPARRPSPGPGAGAVASAGRARAGVGVGGGGGARRSRGTAGVGFGASIAGVTAGRSRAAAAAKKAGAGDGISVQERLQRFHRDWTYVKNTLETPDQKQLQRGLASTEVPARLQAIVDALVDEDARTEHDDTGVCMEYLLKNDVLDILVRLCEADRLPGIKAEVIRAIANMTMLLDDRFLSRQAVHKPVVRLIRICVGDEEDEDYVEEGAMRMTRIGSPEAEGYEEDLVNLMCHICSRIRSSPELLMIFFHDKASPRPTGADDQEADAGLASSPTPSSSASTITSLHKHPLASKSHSQAAAKPEYEFPLFTYLLRFVHREGRTGDFARAGLLFVVSIAMSADNAPNETKEERPRGDGDGHATMSAADARLALAEFILESDFADVLGAGLGAVYGLLPGKLAVLRSNDADASTSMLGGGMSLGAGEASALDAGGEEGLSLEDDKIERLLAQGIDISTDPNVKAQIALFLKLLDFTQDVLKPRGRARDRRPRPWTPDEDRTPTSGPPTARPDGPSSFSAASLVGNAIVSSVLDSVRSIFLQNILYPSLLECTDFDGSAVAVISYIDLMLTVIEDDGPLADAVIGWLLGADDEPWKGAGPRHRDIISLDAKNTGGLAGRDAKVRRRKSTALTRMDMDAPPKSASADIQYFTDALGRYNLKDLISSHLGPETSQATATAALKLMRTFLTAHSRFAITGLLRAIPDEAATAFPFAYAPPLELKRLELDRPTSPGSDVFVYPGGTDEADEEGKPSKNKEDLTDLDDDWSWAADASRPLATISGHMRELDLFLSLVAAIDPVHNKEILSTGYCNYIKDAEEAIVSDPSFQRGLYAPREPPRADDGDVLGGGTALNGARGGALAKRKSVLFAHLGQNGGLRSGSVAGARFFGRNGYAPFKHRLDPQDPLLRLLLSSLTRFFSHSPELNVALTGVLAALATCPFRGLEGWMVWGASAAAKRQARVEADRAGENGHAAGEEGDDDDDDDDRSVDFDMEESSRIMTTPMSIEALLAGDGIRLEGEDEGSSPVVLGLLKSLVQQLERYRDEVIGFDRFLMERRQGLMFVENLNDALGLDAVAFDIGGGPNAFSSSSSSSTSEAGLAPSLAVPDISPVKPGGPPPTMLSFAGAHDPTPGTPRPASQLGGLPVARLSSPPSTPLPGRPAPRREAKSSGLASFLSPAGRKKSSDKNKPLASPNDESTSSGPASPFAAHYEKTGSIAVRPHVANSPLGPWSPEYRGSSEKAKKFEARAEASSPTPSRSAPSLAGDDVGGLDADGDGEGGGSGSSSPAKEGKKGDNERPVSLSTVLDNVVILEETIKELVAIVQVRRSLGVDALRFV